MKRGLISLAGTPSTAVRSSAPWSLRDITNTIKEE
jgi:hypothetical protein